MKIILLLILCVIPGYAITLEALEKGAAAVVQHGESPEAMTDIERAHGMNFVQFVDGFYRWMPLLELMAESDDVEMAKRKQMFPTQEMRERQFYAKSILQFIGKYKPTEAQMKADEGHKFLFAWYLATHPLSEAWHKLLADRLLVKCLGDGYLFQDELIDHIDELKQQEMRIEHGGR